MIKYCRSCKSSDLRKIFSLGNLFFTGKFPKINQKIPKGKLELLICNKCKLTQLSKNFSLKYMYNKDYGYQSGINEAMVKHLKSVVDLVNKFIKLSKNDLVLDIASNDGTLLNLYKKKNIIKFGIDPTLNKFKKNYVNINLKSCNFFSKEIFFKKSKQKAKVITCISMFYDLKSPNVFLKGLKSVLDDDGILILEQSDLSKMIKANSFDTICHEHLEYYSIRSIKRLIDSNNFKIVHHEYNEANGGSSRFVICHSSYNKFKEYKKLNYLIKKEDNLNINNGKALSKMFYNLNKIKNSLNTILYNIVKKNLIIHGYGASTKGNTLIQFFDLGRYINLISDRNIEKVGKFTPDKKMRIISEKESRYMKPDYYLVFPWHFKNNIVIRERNRYKTKTKFIFPLPKIKII